MYANFFLLHHFRHTMMDKKSYRRKCCSAVATFFPSSDVITHSFLRLRFDGSRNGVAPCSSLDSRHCFRLFRAGARPRVHVSASIRHDMLFTVAAGDESSRLHHSGLHHLREPLRRQTKEEKRPGNVLYSGLPARVLSFFLFFFYPLLLNGRRSSSGGSGSCFTG